MKLELEMTLTEFDHVLSGYTALLNLRLMNLCVKAEAAALLAVEVPFKGEKKRIEDVAKVAIPTDEYMEIYPLHEDLIQPIIQSVLEVHPEFKPSRESVHIEEQDKDYRFVRFTMPEVDANRRDLLNSGVDACVSITKAQLDASKQRYMLRLTPDMQGLSDEETDEVKKQFDKYYDMNMELTNTSSDEKKKEIEDGYQRYLTKQQEKEQATQEQSAAEGEDAKKILDTNKKKE